MTSFEWREVCATSDPPIQSWAVVHQSSSVEPRASRADPELPRVARHHEMVNASTDIRLSTDLGVLMEAGGHVDVLLYFYRTFVQVSMLKTYAIAVSRVTGARLQSRFYWSRRPRVLMYRASTNATCCRRGRRRSFRKSCPTKMSWSLFPRCRTSTTMIRGRHTRRKG